MSGGTDYHAHATRQAKEATEATKLWLNSLTPAQRTKLLGMGILSESDPYRVGGHAPGQTSDMAESPLARTEDHVEDLDGQTELLAEEFDVPLATAARILAWHENEKNAARHTQAADLLSIVVGGLLSSKNPRIATASLAFATGMAAINGLGTPAEFARRLGVSRTILSKAMKQWKKSLGLPTSAFQKSDKACATYSEVARDRHWRKQKVSATELMARISKFRKKQAS